MISTANKLTIILLPFYRIPYVLRKSIIEWF